MVRAYIAIFTRILIAVVETYKLKEMPQIRNIMLCTKAQENPARSFAALKARQLNIMLNGIMSSMRCIFFSVL